jgi:hypothetical protein
MLVPRISRVRIVKQVFENEDFDFLKLVAQHLVAQGSCGIALKQGNQAQIVPGADRGPQTGFALG